MTAPDLARIPFARSLNMELTVFEPGYAAGTADVEPEHTINVDTGAVHGGVIFSLADTIGSAAVAAPATAVAPTVDMRIDYLEPATTEQIKAEATVVRSGETDAVVDITVTDEHDEQVATATGRFREPIDDGPWDVAEAPNQPADE